MKRCLSPLCFVVCLFLALKMIDWVGKWRSGVSGDKDDCKLTIDYVGRLHGNPLMEFTSLFYVSRLLRSPVCLPPPIARDLRCFNLTEKHVVLTERGFDRLKLLGRHPSPSNLIGALEGKEELELELEREEVGIFLQNLLLPYRVLRENEKEIRGMFRLKDNMQASVRQYLEGRRAARARETGRPATTIGVHVRRGKYDVRKVGKNLQADLFDGEFYTRAIGKILRYLRLHEKDVVIFVSSDFSEWCKTNIHYPGVELAIVNRDYYKDYPTYGHVPPLEFDLMTVAGCDHVFYDYGSFGFWGALLSRGTVFLPRLYPGMKEGEESTPVKRLIEAGYTREDEGGRFRFVDDLP